MFRSIYMIIVLVTVMELCDTPIRRAPGYYLLLLSALSSYQVPNNNTNCLYYYTKKNAERYDNC